MRSTAEIADNLVMLSITIPTDLWRELKQERLIESSVPTP
jgi:hypothetical protein